VATYLLVTIHEITEYVSRVGATLAAYGGKYMTGRHYLKERLEGDT
jgi:uncharacterized protein (DUF1330 family)